MRTILIAVAAALVGLAAGYLLSRRTIEKQRRTIRSLRAKRGGTETKPKMETTKKVIWVCLIMGFAWVWSSYILAYLDRVQIAESLSQVAVTEIIGVVLAYCIKSAVENLSKNNNWPDKAAKPSQQTPEGPEPEHEEPPDAG